MKIMMKLLFSISLLFCTAQASLAADWRGPEGMNEEALQLESVMNADGTLSIYYIEQNKEIAHTRQIAPNSSEWTRRKSLGMYGNQIRVTRRADDRLEMFIIGTIGNVLTHSVQTKPGGSEWSKERDLGIYARQIEVARHPDDSLLLFFLDMGTEFGYLKQANPTGTAYQKPNMLGLNGISFAVGTHADGRIELVNVGTLGNVLYHARETKAGSGVFGSEHEMKGRYAKQVALVSNKDGTLVLYYLNMGNKIAYKKASADGWEKRVKTGIHASNFDVSRAGDGRVHIFLVGTFLNVLSHLAQIEPNGQEWTKEADLKEGYGWYLNAAPYENGKMNLFFIGMIGNKVYSYSGT